MKKYITLGDVCYKGSSNIAQKDLEGLTGEYPIYGAAGFIKNVDFYIQSKPYIALVKDGAGIGRAMILPAKSSVISTMQYIIPSEAVNIQYLYYAICSMNLSKYFSGATIPHIYFKDYQKERFVWVDAETQKNIVKLLTVVDSLLILCKEQLKEFDILARSQFIEMFGDVIHNNKAWPVRKFSDITSSRLGKMLDTKKQTGKECYPYLANFNVQWFRFNLENLNKMDFDEADRIEFKLCDGDLLVCEGGEIGRCAVWHNELQPCFFQKAVHRVRCNQQIIHQDYLAWWFRYICAHGGFAKIVGAKSTIAHLTGVKLKQLIVTVPPIELQNKFADFVAQVNKSKLAIQQSLNELETLN